MRYFVWEFGRFLWRRVNKICLDIINDEANPDLLDVSDKMMVRLLFLDESGSEGDCFINSGVGIDESVYTKNRCFRLVGMHKMRLDGSHGVPFSVVPLKSASGYRAYRYLQPSCSPGDLRTHFREHFVWTLITHYPNPLDTSSSVAPLVRLRIGSNFPSRLAIEQVVVDFPEKYGARFEPLLVLKNPSREDRADLVRFQEMAQVVTDACGGPNVIQTSRTVVLESSQNIAKSTVWGLPHGRVDEDRCYFNSYGYLVPLWDVEDGEYVFHDCGADLYSGGQNKDVFDHPKFQTNNAHQEH
jgi:hypothetical protein